MILTQSNKHSERECSPENRQKNHPRMKDNFGENAMDANDQQPNEEKLTELRHEFIKSKQFELENLVRKSHFGFTQWDLHLLMTGCTCSVLLTNLIARNAVLALCSLFTLTLMLKLRLARDAFTHISAAALVLLESVLLIVHVCTTELNGRLDKLMRILTLLLLLALNAHLDSWLALDLNRIGRYNCASNFIFEINMLKSTELLAFMSGAILTVCALFFIVHLYSVSYILFIIVVFAYTSRWRFALCLERDHTTVLDRIKTRKNARGPRIQSIWRYDSKRSDGRSSSGRFLRGFGSTRLSIRSNSMRTSELNFFPSVQSLITFIIILITLLILVFSVLNNNLLSISRQPHFNDYLERFSSVYQRKLTIKVKLLCIFSFIMLFAMFVQFSLYIFYFFKKTNFLSRLLYSRVVLLFSLCSASKNAYYNLVVTSRLNLAGQAASARLSTNGPNPEPESSRVDNKNEDGSPASPLSYQQHSLNNALTSNNFLNTREMRIESYHLDHWGRVMRVETLCKRQINSYSYINNYLDNNNFSCIVKKLTGNKIVRRLTHRSRNIFNRLNTTNNRVKRGLDGRTDTLDPFSLKIWHSHNQDQSPLSPLYNSSPLHPRPGDESVISMLNASPNMAGAAAPGQELVQSATFSNLQSRGFNAPDAAANAGFAANLIEGGCSYPVIVSPRLTARLNCSELYLFIQSYVLVNSEERSLYCLPRYEQGLNLLVYQDSYLTIKNKLAQYNHEFFKLLRFFIDNKLFDNPNFFDNFGHFNQQAQYMFPDQLNFGQLERSASESADGYASDPDLLAHRKLTRTLSENDMLELSKRGLGSIDLSRLLTRVRSESPESFHRLSIPTEFLSSSRSFSTDTGLRLMPEEEDVISRFTALSYMARFDSAQFPDPHANLGDDEFDNEHSGASNSELNLGSANQTERDGRRSSRAKHVRASDSSQESSDDFSPSQLVSDKILAREAKKKRRVKYLTKFFNRRFNANNLRDSEQHLVEDYDNFKHMEANQADASADTTPNRLYGHASEGAFGGTSRSEQLHTAVDNASAPNASFTQRSLAERMLARPGGTLGGENSENDPDLGPDDVAGLDLCPDAAANADTAKQTNRDPAASLETSHDGAPSAHGSADASPKHGAAKARTIVKPKLSALNKQYELEYEVNSKHSFKKLFSTATAPPATNVRIKKLQLDNNFNNNYIYTRTIKFNTVNKFVIKNDSTGTNLVRDSSPSGANRVASGPNSPATSTPLRSPLRAAAEPRLADTGDSFTPVRPERQQYETPRFSDLPEPDRALDQLATSKPADTALELSRLNTDDLFPDKLIGTSPEADESVEKKVNSIMDELMKDLNLDF